MDQRYKYTMSKGHRSANKDGYVYEHILVAEEKLGRHLYPGEIVHHIDHNKRNNNIDNLMVFKSNNDHIAFHHGCRATQLPDGAWVSNKEMTVINGHKVSLLDSKECLHCGMTFIPFRKDSKFCSHICSQFAHRRCERPDKETLANEIRQFSFVSLGSKYGVSDKTIVKWCKYYGLPYRKADIKSIQ